MIDEREALRAQLKRETEAAERRAAETAAAQAATKSGGGLFGLLDTTPSGAEMAALRATNESLRNELRELRDAADRRAAETYAARAAADGAGGVLMRTQTRARSPARGGPRPHHAASANFLFSRS